MQYQKKAVILRSNFTKSMSLAERIRNLFTRDSHNILRRRGLSYVPTIEITRHRFGETIFLNAAQLLTDIYAELFWETSKTGKAVAWKVWADTYGQRDLLRLYRDGFVVVGYTAGDKEGRGWSFYDLPDTAYEKDTIGDDVVIRCHNKDQEFYVIQSPTFIQTGLSDYYWCRPFIKLADAALNGATTTSERLGGYVVLSPKTNEFGGVITEQERDDIEKEIEEDYGMLSKQKQLMLLSRPMDAQIVSLANVDIRMQEKVKAAACGIADRLKIPANQIAFIDAQSSKSLANGTELREGDLAKYRTFRRLIDATLYKMAHDLGIFVNYRLENEPLTVQGQQIEQNNE